MKNTARALNDCVRKNDLVFRIGGDEFLLLLNCPDEEKANMAKERVIEQLKELALSESMTGSGAAFSFGVSTGRFHEIRDLMNKADMNMYRIKHETKA